MRIFVFGVLVVAACGKGGAGAGSGSAEIALAPIAPIAPIAIVLGDCSGSDDALWVSGPMPSKGSAPHSVLVDAPDTSHDAENYGKLGHGRGAGAGYGGGSGSTTSTAVPTASPGQLSANGNLDKNVIRRYVHRNLQKFQYCYEKQLLSNPKLSGTVTVQFTIGADGNVASSDAAGVDPLVSGCVADVMKGIEFPKPKGGVVQVNYPFTFMPVDAPKPDRAEGQSKMKKGGGDAADQVSPLIDRVAELRSCFAKTGKAYGIAVIDIQFDQGKQSERGIDDAGFAACIAAMKLPPSNDRPNHLHCSVAFGAQPLDAMPAIAIDNKDVVFNKTVVDHVATLSGANIPALSEALRAWAPTAPVSLRGVGMIEAPDAMPMGAINRVLVSANETDTYFVLARADGAKWKPLSQVQNPVAPMVAGTGRSWNGTYAKPVAGDNEMVMLSIYVTKPRIWIGVSRVNEFIEVGHDWAKLEANLKDHKASTFFTDRSDIEIAGDDDVPYGDVLHAIDLASKIGFSDWRVVTASGLSAKPGL